MSGPEFDAQPVGPSDPLAQPLRRLTGGFGIRSATLHADLGPELRQLFHVPDWDTDARRTLARVTWQLDRLISTQLVGDDLQRVARASYNLGVSDIYGLKLGQRRAWLHKMKGRPSPSESQRDLRDTIVPAFVASLRGEPPTRPTDKDLAALMAAETGRPASDFLPFPTGQPSETPPPAPDHPVHGIHVTIGRLIVIVMSLSLVIVVAVVVSFMGRSGSRSQAPASNTATTTQPRPARTVTEVGGNRHGSPTFKDPFRPAETGQVVPFRQEVQVSCKLRAFSIDSIGPDGYWYRIASPPWDDRYYAPAITFLNGDPVDGPYEHNYDPAVPDC